MRQLPYQGITVGPTRLQHDLDRRPLPQMGKRAQQGSGPRGMVPAEGHEYPLICIQQRGHEVVLGHVDPDNDPPASALLSYVVPAHALALDASKQGIPYPIGSSPPAKAIRPVGGRAWGLEKALSPPRIGVEPA